MLHDLRIEILLHWLLQHHLLKGVILEYSVIVCGIQLSSIKSAQHSVIYSTQKLDGQGIYQEVLMLREHLHNLFDLDEALPTGKNQRSKLLCDKPTYIGRMNYEQF